MSSRLLWIRRVAPFAWMGFMFWLSAQPHLPSAPEPWLDLLLKKLGHAALYAVLAALWWQAFLTTPISPRQAALWAFIISALYGASDEFHQSFVPGRSARVTDVLIDAAGAAVAILTRERWVPLLRQVPLPRPPLSTR